MSQTSKNTCLSLRRPHNIMHPKLYRSSVPTCFFILSFHVLFSLLTRVSLAHGLTRTDASLHTKTITNGSASGHPQFFYPGNIAGHSSHQPGVAVEVDRDPRQWLNAGYGYGSPYYGLGMWGGTEMILTCLLVVLGIGVIGLPFLLLIFSAFTGGQGGLNFMPPTTTTTVAGRRKREASSIFPDVNPDLQSKLLDILGNFYRASDKMQSFKKFLDKA